MRVICRIIENPVEDDDFGLYKAPYQAAECLCCLPPDCVKDMLSSESVIDTLFSLMDNKVMRKTYVPSANLTP